MSTTETQYLTLISDLWGVYYEDLGKQITA